MAHENKEFFARLSRNALYRLPMDLTPAAPTPTLRLRSNSLNASPQRPVFFFHALAAAGQHRQPKSKKGSHTDQHNQRPSDIMVERPRAQSVHRTPDDDAAHDPAEQTGGNLSLTRSHRLGVSRIAGRWVNWHAHSVGAKKPPERSRFPKGGIEAEPFPGAIGQKI